MAFALLLNALALFVGPDPDSIAQSFMKQRQIPGLAYAVLVNGTIVSRGAYGYTNVATKERTTLNSVFPIASLSKPFVAMGILALAEKNRITLDEPVGKYLPELPEGWRSIPIKRLLDHTSGVPDQVNSGKYDFYDPKPVSSDELIKKLVALPLQFVAGEKYEYSNGNYVLLAKVIERISGQPYEAFLNERIFLPLGMKNTRALKLSDLPLVAQGYRTGKDGPNLFEFNPDWCYGNGALGSSIIDLARLDAALYTQRLLRQTTLNYITTAQPLNNGEKPGYAMGWMVGLARGNRVVSHSGRVGGWQSYYSRFPDLNATVVVISNNFDGNLDLLANDLAGSVLPSLSFAPIRDDYPALSAQHLNFVRSIEEGKVDVTKLSPGLRADYDKKDHWNGISGLLKNAGAILNFEPVSRRQTSSGLFTTQYRLEQKSGLWKIELTWDADGIMTGLMVLSY